MEMAAKSVGNKLYCSCIVLLCAGSQGRWPLPVHPFAFNYIEVIRKLDNTMVQHNYLQIKHDVQDFIEAEMERLLNDPWLAHLVVHYFFSFLSTVPFLYSTYLANFLSDEIVPASLSGGLIRIFKMLFPPTMNNSILWQIMQDKCHNGQPFLA